MTSETAALSYGLASAIVWGAADFNGGLAAKKGQLMGVVGSSQMIGGVSMVLAAVITSEPIPPLPHLLYGGLAGLFGVLGLLALYRGLAQGRMGIVAPLSAVLTALVPMGYTILHIGLPSTGQMVGFVFFTAAVWLLSSGDADFKMTVNELFLAVSGGLGFGLFFIFIDKSNDLAVFWPLVSAKVAAVTMLLAVIRFSGKPSVPTSEQWLFIFLSGSLDAEDDISQEIGGVKWHVCFGSQAFVARIKEKYGTGKFDKEIPSIRELLPNVTLIIGTVCSFFDVSDFEIFKNRRGKTNEVSNAAIYLTRKLRRDTLKDIGGRFEIHNERTVRSVVERMRIQLRKDCDFVRQLDKLTELINKSQKSI